MFLSLWIVLPITAGLRVGAVLARGVLASVLGGVAAGIVALLVHEVTGPQTPLDLGLLLGVLDAILRDVALVVLAAVLLWLWLRRERAAPEV